MKRIIAASALVLALSASGLAAAQDHYGDRQGPGYGPAQGPGPGYGPGQGPGYGPGPGRGDGGVPPGAVADLHGREAALREQIRHGVLDRTLDHRIADHATRALSRMDTNERQWERRQQGRLYPNQLASLNQTLDGIHREMDERNGRGPRG